MEQFGKVRFVPNGVSLVFELDKKKKKMMGLSKSGNSSDDGSCQVVVRPR